jgi:bifunctional DNase/RNase
MTLMQIQEFTFCSHHKRGLIVLENVAHRLTLAFDVHPDEVPRLARIMKGSQQVVHPLYDFIQALLEAFLVTPTDVVLDDVPGKGLMAFVQVQRAGTMLSIPCYALDALALAAQMKTPIYATERALVHAEPRTPAPNLLVHESEEDVQAWLARIKPTDFPS